VSGKKLIAETLQDGDLEKWEVLALREGCFFDSMRWTALFEPGIRRIGLYDRGGALRGGFVVWEERKFGLRVLRNPPFTPYAGPFFEYRATNAAAATDEQRSVVSAMVDYLSTKPATVVSLGLAPYVTDCLPFYWRGWKVVPRYTYRLDLTQDEDALLSGLSKERRNDIRKARKDGLAVLMPQNGEALESLARETFCRQALPFPSGTIEAILAEFSAGKNSFSVVTETNGTPTAAVYVVHDSAVAYYLIGGYAAGAHHGAGALAMWYAILKAKELGLEVFDFEGSVIPPIERYFRGFGAALTPVFGVHKAWLPLEIVLKFRRRYRNRF